MPLSPSIRIVASLAATDRSSSSVACTAGSPLTRGVGGLRMAVVLDSSTSLSMERSRLSYSKGDAK